MITLTHLAKNKNIIITSDKDGGVAILDTIDYHKKKLTNLLDDLNTYNFRP